MKKRLHSFAYLLTSTWAYSFYASCIVLLIYLLSSLPNVRDNKEATDGICSIKNIIDGDSLQVRCKNDVFELRLQYIDAPEITQIKWGAFAKKKLTDFVDMSIYVKFKGKDYYNRNLALIYQTPESQQPINLKLVECGAARVYSRYNPPMVYRNAMVNAKLAKRGIWQKKGLHQDPAKYRRLAY